MNLFVSGIGTNVGKTIVSAVLTEALQADYWKPIQSGTIEGKDSDTIKSLISNTHSIVHPETYLLREPLSPHFAAKLENITIDFTYVNPPLTGNTLIIEGAGGLLVPINNNEFVIDLARKFHCEIVVVISNYLGCINHSLLSIDYLVRNNFVINSLIFNGAFELEVKNVIANAAPDCQIIDIPTFKTLSKNEVKVVADHIRQQMML